MVDKSSSSSPADTMRERVSESKVKLWVLLELNRWVLAGILMTLILLVLLVVGKVDPVPLSEVVESSDPIETLFQAMVGAIITGVTLVVTINQLVLSQELGPAGDQRERMNGAMEFRQDIEPHIEDDVSPVDPASFFQSLLEAVRTQATKIASLAEAETSERYRADLDLYAADVTAHADQVINQLESAEFGTFETLSAALNFNYSAKIYNARTLRAEYGEQLSDASDTEIEELITILELFGPAREHFKTLYFQWELINLSRAVLYVSVPAIVTACSMILFADNLGSIPGSTVGISNILLVTGLATVVSLAPFVLFLSYILRIATIAKHTLSIGPFILRRDDVTEGGDSN